MTDEAYIHDATHFVEFSAHPGEGALAAGRPQRYGPGSNFEADAPRGGFSPLRAVAGEHGYRYAKAHPEGDETHTNPATGRRIRMDPPTGAWLHVHPHGEVIAGGTGAAELRRHLDGLDVMRRVALEATAQTRAALAGAEAARRRSRRYIDHGAGAGDGLDAWRGRARRYAHTGPGPH
jgi:hypothetical protein